MSPVDFDKFNGHTQPWGDKPGWHAQQNKDGEWTVFGERGGIEIALAEVVFSKDAELIATAPTLLSHLRDAVAALKEISSLDGDNAFEASVLLKRAKSIARSTLSKIKGT